MASTDAAGENDDGLRGARYTPAEIAAALRALSDADLFRVEAAARYFAPRSGMPPEELQQETFCRALEVRTCQVGTGMVAFLCGVMRSIASEAPRARRRAAEDGGLELVYVQDYEGPGMPQVCADAVSPEDDALSGLYNKRHLEGAMACIDDDYDLQMLVMGMFEGQRGKELEGLLGTDAQGLAAHRKRLTRRLMAAFPGGSPL